jgi:hypothetical protein
VSLILADVRDGKGEREESSDNESGDGESGDEESGDEESGDEELGDRLDGEELDVNQLKDNESGDEELGDGLDGEELDVNQPKGNESSNVLQYISATCRTDINISGDDNAADEAIQSYIKAYLCRDAEWVANAKAVPIPRKLPDIICRYQIIERLVNELGEMKTPANCLGAPHCAISIVSVC